MLQALFAGHLAAPLEDALAIGLLLHNSTGMASIAAQSIASIRTRAGHIALPALSSQGPRFCVGWAKVGGLVGEHQLILVRRPRVRTLRHEAVPVVAQRHLPGTVVPIPQSSSHLSERRHLQPAGLHRAGAGQPVALALQSHGIANGLKGIRIE